ncbi:carboxypeptidase-like regulatory domain-containing protein [Prevotella sp. HUN102]|uniref:carboxypeptidase-like regulatory domain-containing protein n=1 Tax=Prevotella sp. HUN102 TaxID=1392486 RepID=UPI0009DE7A5D|nr:carboxypeptidase-like regulatory domain-containing protein [Prevotella sp. HUN102]
MKALLRYITFALLSMIALHSHAQTMLTGTVRLQKTGQPLAGVMVKLKQKDNNRILKFAQTQADGSYKIQVSSPLKGYELQFSLMGYATETVSLSEGQTQYDKTMTEKPTELKEVIVKAPSIRQRGDTLTYNVASFADGNDKSLADVLKKMPGIEVSESGEIKHNGKTLNKFYIEGRDMLGGRYNLATTNIHQTDVASVEVLQNHQPVKALDDISFSESPAINIKLKEAAKSRLVGTVKAGGGFRPNVWEGETTLMRFSKKAQLLNTLKSNNIGTDVTKDNTVLIDDIGSGFLSHNYSLKNYIDATPDRLMEISENRVRRNQTHTVSMNNLWGVGKNTDLSTQLIYSRDRLVSASHSQTSYFLNDSIIATDDSQAAKTKQNKLSASIVLTTNSNKLYLSNTLSTDLQWNDTHINMKGTYPNVQTANQPAYKVHDKFELLRRNGRHTFTFNSYNAYLSSPHTLQVERPDGTQHQSVRSNAFFSNNTTSLGYYLKPFMVSMKLGLVALSRSMKSRLEGVPDSLGVMENSIGMTYLRAYVSPEAEFSSGGWEIKLALPVNYTPYFFKDRLSQTSDNHHRIMVSPNIYVQYQFSSKIKMSLSGSFAQNDLNEQNFYNGLILGDYRNLNTGFVNYDNEHRKSLSLSFYYKQPLNTLFANAYITRSWNENALTKSRRFAGDYILNSYLARKNHSNSWMAGARVSKGIDLLRGMASLSTDYMGINGALVQNAGLSHYQSYLWNITAKFNIHPFEWLGINYELTSTNEAMKLKDANVKSSSNSLSQRIVCNFNITKAWMLKLSGEHYSNQLSDDTRRKLFLADISTAYTFANGVELSLNVRNLFNQKTYSYTHYTDLMQMRQEYELRPRNIWASVFFHF